jgi:predicted ester cyclase
MLNTSVETYPNVLSATAVIGDSVGVVNRAGGNLNRIEELMLGRELAEGWIQKGVSSLYAEGLYAQSNKDLCRRFIQKIFNEGELPLISEFMAPDVVNHDITDSFGDTEPLQAHKIGWTADLVYLYRHAFPDLVVEIQDQIAEGDQVVTRLRVRGTHKNALMAIAASGRKIDIAAIRIDRMADGKIVESWSHFDVMGMLHQIGALPEINRRPQQVAPVSYETVTGSKLPVPEWNPAPTLPQPAFIS